MQPVSSHSADPMATLAEVAASALGRICGLDGVDPVVRPSDRADAQINGAMALGKQVGRPPREIAEELVASGALDGVCSTAEVAGP